MTRTKRLFASASVLAAAAFSASPAFAAGTASGTSITNTVFLDYQVGGVSQTQLSATDSFVVDRKVVVSVSEVGSATTQVGPGQAVAVTTFLVANGSNGSVHGGPAAPQALGGR